MNAGQDSDNVIELNVSGMTCAACAARIQKKLNKLDGVAASVNYATEKAHVVSSLPAVDLISAIQAAGYDASLPSEDDETIDRAAEIKRRLIISASLAIPVILIAMIPMLQFPGWQWLSFALATPVVLWGAWPFHHSAMVNLRHGATTMDTLISLGTSAAYLWSVYALFFGSAGEIGLRHEWSLMLCRCQGLSSVYFEAAVGIISFILLGRYIEARSRQDASSALRALAEVGAKSVTVLKDGVETKIPIEALAVDDEFIVRPGEKIATDGIVIEGYSAVDNAIITGESVPVEIGPGSTVVGAAVNATGLVKVKATAVGEDTQLAQIAQLVELAQTGKSRSQDLANKIAGIFVPIVIGLALITLIGWLIAGADMTFAITAAVSVLIISCPCALGLATPTALLAGSLRGSQLGILIRGPHALEQAHRIDVLALDKTGTITAGIMSVTKIVAGKSTTQAEVLAIAAAAEAGSEHPIAAAILTANKAQAGGEYQLTEFAAIPGRGVTARLNDEQIVVGNQLLLVDQNCQLDPELIAASQDVAASIVYVARNGRTIGLIQVADEIADGAIEAINQFHQLGLRTVMITGDNEAAAKHIASQVGIDEVRAEVLPAEKFQVVKNLQAQGKHQVAMLGDGINDAAALSQADLGIAMGSGTDAAIAASDLTLMRHDLRLAASAIKLSRRTLSTIRGNLFWAFIYNICAIPIAAWGYLNPMLAGAAMAFSSVFVVTNSLRLRHYQPN